MMELINKTPILVASTNDTYSCSIDTSHEREREVRGTVEGQEAEISEKSLQDAWQSGGEGVSNGYLELNHFKSGQWYE